MITIQATEMNSICHLMIANDHYSVKGLRELVDSYNDPYLSLALDCVMEEGTIDTIIKFFMDNLYHYPEALIQNTGMDFDVYPSELLFNSDHHKALRNFFISSN